MKLFFRKCKTIVLNFYGSLFAQLGWLLPCDSTKFGPPRRTASTGSYCKSKQCVWKEVYPEEATNRIPPTCFNYDATKMTAHLSPRVLAAGVAVLYEARVVSPAGWVVTKDDTFLPDHSWFGTAPEECPIYKSWNLRPEVTLKGRTLSLLSDWSSINYGHTLLDAFSRVHLFEKASLGSWDELDHVLTRNVTSEGMKSLVQLAGIPAEKIYVTMDAKVIQCEELIAPTFPGTRRSSPAWVPEFWRSKAPPANGTRGRRLYITRKSGVRGVANEEEIAPLLLDFGFEVLDPADRARWHLFQEAEIVMGPHGAGVSDIIFCPRNATLIELVSPLHIYPYYYTAAEAAGVNYYSVLGSLPPGARGESQFMDFHISPAVLKGVLEKVTSNLPSNQRSHR
jgi:hypothetical protein